ncbi:MAG: hypothetical protein ING66_05780 [Rhodocyclaceae bacterium]|nr:hypothetical protein [Rhodocyclaceae bacterium]MCA3061476.1 hypothetical protein [Rhodocyclaceae bacterium]MCA3084001.1 hypothetical protein [Rhodocyclaceae bacterium]
MSGFLFLGLLVLWVYVVVRVVRFALARISNKKWHVPTAIALSAFLMLLPVMDELLSRPAFNKLCAEGTKLKFDAEKLRGKTVYSVDAEQPDILVGVIPGYVVPSRYADVTTGELLISTNSYTLRGGLLMRSFGLPEWNKPLTMDGFCRPTVRPYHTEFAKQYQLTYRERRV